MPWDALPEHLNSPEKWKGTDNDTWYARWTLQIKGWFAMGPRAKEWWAKWSFPPVEVFKIGGAGPWRYEVIPATFGADGQNLLDLKADPLDYGVRVLSRCQYFKRWAFTVSRVWFFPLVTLHWYWRAKDVPTGDKPWVNDFDITKLVFMYGPFHWDADIIYWILSFYLGGQWK